MATRFGSSEPSSGQFIVYGHGAFSGCALHGTHWMHHIRIWSIGLKMVHYNRNMLLTMY